MMVDDDDDDEDDDDKHSFEQETGRSLRVNNDSMPC